MCKVSRQQMAVLYPEKSAVGVISPQPCVNDYKGKICRWDIGLIKLTETFDALS